MFDGNMLGLNHNQAQDTITSYVAPDIEISNVPVLIFFLGFATLYIEILEKILTMGYKYTVEFASLLDFNYYFDLIKI